MQASVGRGVFQGTSKVRELKGDKGIVIYERAVKNSILVDFSASAHEEKCISVDINDLKRV